MSHATLIELTPWPPASDDPAVVLAAAEQMMAARAPVLAAISEKLGPCEELAARQRAWDQKLAELRDRLTAARLGLARTRRAYR